MTPPPIAMNKLSREREKSIALSIIVFIDSKLLFSSPLFRTTHLRPLLSIRFSVFSSKTYRVLSPYSFSFSSSSFKELEK